MIARSLVLLSLLAASFATPVRAVEPAASAPVRASLRTDVVFEVRNVGTRFGQSVFVLGDLPELGGGRMEQAVKLECSDYPTWRLAASLPAGVGYRFRHVVRDDAPAKLSDPSNGEFLGAETVVRGARLAPASPPRPRLVARLSPSRVEVHGDFPSRELGNSRAVRVYLPRGYDSRAQARFPVLYMHDGQNIFSPGGPFGSWDVDKALDRMIEAGEVPELIVVGVDNTADRIREYMPPYSAHEGQSGIGDKYARFLIDEVAPFIEAKYRAIPDREQRLIGGSSLGGLISSYIAWTHPRFASRALCFSPAFWGREIVGLFRAQPARDVVFYFDSGDRGDTHDGLVDTYAARDALLAAGKYRLHENLFHLIGYGDGHNEAAWRKRFPAALKTILGTRR